MDDYKHFLPRIFELITQYRPPYEIWIVFDKITLGDFDHWDLHEKEVVYAFLIALWEHVLNDPSEDAAYFFSDYFSAIAHFYPSFSHLLELWTAAESESAAVHLGRLILEEGPLLFEQNKIRGFHDRSENADEFLDWILSDFCRNKLIKNQPNRFLLDAEKAIIEMRKQLAPKLFPIGS